MKTEGATFETVQTPGDTFVLNRPVDVAFVVTSFPDRDRNVTDAGIAITLPGLRPR